LAFDEAVMRAQALDAHDRTCVDAEQQDHRGSNTSEQTDTIIPGHGNPF
jgi:hypothetical protein